MISAPLGIADTYKTGNSAEGAVAPEGAQPIPIVRSCAEPVPKQEQEVNGGELVVIFVDICTPIRSHKTLS
jgi:hypothetical protein